MPAARSRGALPTFERKYRACSVRLVTQIRRATPDDAADVARLLHDFNTEYEEFTPGIEVLTQNAREMITARDMLVLLAGGGPDGFAELRFRKSVWTARLD